MASVTSHPASPPGTVGYFPDLLARLRTAAPSLPLEPLIFQSLLLCLVAGEKNLILRTQDEDISTVQKIAASILTSVLGFTTQKVKCRSKRSPTDFLRSLFLTQPSASASSRKKRSSSRKSHSTITSGSFLPRSSSITSELAASSSNLFSPFADQSHNGTPTTTSSSPLLGPVRNRDEQQSEISFNTTPDTVRRRAKTRPPLAQTPADSESVLASPFTPLTLPRAVVISGLEHVGLPAQRAFMQMLADKRLVLDEDGGEVWNLPADFIVVYVCPLDDRERPSVHNGLLDRFAMSAHIILANNIRESIPSHHSRSRYDPDSLGPSVRGGLLQSSELAILRSLAADSGLVHLHPALSLYIADLFAGTRHHPELDGTLLTRRAHIDVEDLVRAHRVIFGDSTGTDLIRLATGEKTTEEWEDDQSHARSRNRTSSTRTEDYESEIEDMTTVRVSWDWKGDDGGGDAVRKLGVGSQSEPDHEDPRDTQDQGHADHEVMDVSEADVAKVVPRVVSHRVRVRDGPQDEILGNVMFCAVGPSPAFKPTEQDIEWERRTVKEIIVEVLADI
ncbi:hypothetical protein OE88DRAFT_1733444 [Heliocybe sulcata]|uniref:Uncharacterized protein n=1 Tax=Heliocybe sulcata TaxID=5364 RepID=A0A5C3NC06_9AGAM|nr:hypothetical protein OE88DRAFT_1733444 [Heliocybe sulcata]